MTCKKIVLFTVIFGLMLSIPGWAEEGETAKISFLIGTVDVRLSRHKPWIPAQEGMSLTEGAKIKTGKDGRVEIILPDDSTIQLKEKSDLTIAHLYRPNNRNGRDTLLESRLGKLRAEVIKLDSASSSFKIKTPAAVAGVRGTVFFLDVNRRQSKLFVAENTKGVWFKNTKTGKGFLVTQGNGSTSYWNGKLLKPHILSDKERDFWQKMWDPAAFRKYLGGSGDEGDEGEGEGGDEGGDGTSGDIDDLTGGSDDLGKQGEDEKYSDQNNVHDPDDSDLDNDGDGLTNGEERALGTDENNPDTDGDGLLDGFEVTYELNPNNPKGDDGAEGDPDGDKMTNLQEQYWQINPQSSDTDEDGIDDRDDAFPGDGGIENIEEDLMETRFPIRLFSLADMFLGLGLNQELPASGDGIPFSGDAWGDWIDGVFPPGDLYSWFDDLPWVREGIKDKIVEIADMEMEYEGKPELLQHIDDIIQERPWMSPNDIKNMLWSDIAQIRTDLAWRAMDDVMTRVSDAQMGKVMTDCHGYRVRMEQYILRPAAKTVQFLTLNLRGSSAGSLAGLTALDWRTNFNNPVESSQLRNLPWQDYLTTHNSEPYITSSHSSYTGTNYIAPTDMKIALMHGNAVGTIAMGDLLFEITKFAERGLIENEYRQYIDYCMLGAGSGMVDFSSNWDDPYISPVEGFFGVVDGLWLYRNPEAVTTQAMDGGAWFVYDLPNSYGPPAEPFFVQEATESWGEIMSSMDSFRLNANFYVIDDNGTILTNSNISEIANLRDALRVGFFELSAGSNLEMSFLLFGASPEDLSGYLGDPHFSEEGMGIYQLSSAPIDIVISPAPIPAAEDGDPKWSWHERQWDE